MELTGLEGEEGDAVPDLGAVGISTPHKKSRRRTSFHFRKSQTPDRLNKRTSFQATLNKRVCCLVSDRCGERVLMLFQGIIGDFTLNRVRSNALTVVAYAYVLWRFVMMVVGWKETGLETAAGFGLVPQSLQTSIEGVRILELWFMALLFAFMARLVLVPNHFRFSYTWDFNDKILLVLSGIVVFGEVGMAFTAFYRTYFIRFADFSDGGVNCRCDSNAITCDISVGGCCDCVPKGCDDFGMPILDPWCEASDVPLLLNASSFLAANLSASAASTAHDFGDFCANITVPVCASKLGVPSTCAGDRTCSLLLHGNLVRVVVADLSLMVLLALRCILWARVVTSPSVNLIRHRYWLMRDHVLGLLRGVNRPKLTDLVSGLQSAASVQSVLDPYNA
jgi:hypothetical protein